MRNEMMRVCSDILSRPPRRVFLAALLLGILLGITPAGVQADQNVELTWNPSANSNVIGYNIYYGTESGSYPFLVSVDNVTDTQISGLADGVTYYFAVSASDSAGDESVLSEEVSYSVPPPPPVTLVPQVEVDEQGQPLYLVITSLDSISGWWELDYSTDLIQWNVYSFGFGYGNFGRYGNGLHVRVPLGTDVTPQFFRLLKY